MPENRAIHQAVEAFRQRLREFAPLVPANTKSTIFDYHNCWKCKDGTLLAPAQEDILTCATFRTPRTTDPSLEAQADKSTVQTRS